MKLDERGAEVQRKHKQSLQSEEGPFMKLLLPVRECVCVCVCVCVCGGGGVMILCHVGFSILKLFEHHSQTNLANYKDKAF